MSVLPSEYRIPASNLVSRDLKLRARFMVKRPQEFLQLISDLQPLQLKELQEYLWDSIMEESERRGLNLTRSDIISRFEPTTNYQYRAGCQEPLGYCTLTMCIQIDGRCATNRLRGMVDVLRKILADIYKDQELDSKLRSLESGSIFPKQEVTMKPEEEISDPEPPEEESFLVEPEIADADFGLAIKQKVSNLREILFSIIEIEGADTVALIDSHGNIIEMVSHSRLNTKKLDDLLSKQVDVINTFQTKYRYNGLKLMVSEHKQGLMILRRLTGQVLLFLVTRGNEPPAKMVQRMKRVAKELNHLFEIEVA